MLMLYWPSEERDRGTWNQRDPMGIARGDEERVQDVTRGDERAAVAHHVDDRRFAGDGDGFLEAANLHLGVHLGDQRALECDWSRRGLETGEREGRVKARAEVDERYWPAASVTTEQTFSLSTPDWTLQQ